MLSFDSLAILIANAPVLITNDSAPVHIAGAFDKFIILLATCKHPDNVLPYRNGADKHYKAKAMYKKLTCDDWDSSPTRVYRQTADKIKGDILEYLPEPSEVVEEAVRMFGLQKALGDDSTTILSQDEIDKKKAESILGDALICR
jgi:hypothetical protein